jgi:hypothetical protein
MSLLLRHALTITLLQASGLSLLATAAGSGGVSDVSTGPRSAVSMTIG